jgi:hypothetical protein
MALTDTAKTVYEEVLDTVNRGKKTFIVAKSTNGKFYAYEIGDLTQMAKILGGISQNAHRLNPTTRWANQHKRYMRLVGLPTLQEAIDVCKKRANEHVTYH